MPALTPRTGYYLPGGGSLSIGGDDEAADIDRINETFQKIDATIGAPSVTRADTLTPFDGQIVREGADVYAWHDAIGKWTQLNPHVGTSEPTNPEEGFLWVDTN